MAKAKGSPKSGGRKKGTPNKTTLDARTRIEKEADPVGFWIKVAKGEMFKRGAPNNPIKQTDWWPTLEQSMAAHARLLNKLVADIRAVEISTPEDKVLRIKIVE